MKRRTFFAFLAALPFAKFFRRAEPLVLHDESPFSGAWERFEQKEIIASARALKLPPLDPLRVERMDLEQWGRVRAHSDAELEAFTIPSDLLKPIPLNFFKKQ